MSSHTDHSADRLSLPQDDSLSSSTEHSADSQSLSKAKSLEHSADSQRASEADSLDRSADSQSMSKANLQDQSAESQSISEADPLTASPRQTVRNAAKVHSTQSKPSKAASSETQADALVAAVQGADRAEFVDVKVRRQAGLIGLLLCPGSCLGVCSEAVVALNWNADCLEHHAELLL